MAYEKLTKEDYNSIGWKAGLTDQRLRDYVEFMPKAFPDQRDSAYAREWAGRFKKGNEWHSSDDVRRKVLKTMQKKYWK